MEDRNKDTLKRAIENLPQYEPKPIVWGQLSSQLDVVVSQQQLESSLTELPQYEPPETIWNAIETELGDREPSEGKPSSRKWIPIGFLLLSLGSLFAWWHINAEEPIKAATEDEVPVYSFYEEAADASFELRTEEDDAVFAEIDAILQGPLYDENNPDWVELKMEWEELAFAKKEIKKVLTGFNDNEDLYVKMVSIERSQTDLTKKILRNI